MHKRLYCLLSLAIVSVGCHFLLDLDYHAVTQDGPPKHVATDSPEVRRLLAEEERDDERVDHMLKEAGSDAEGLRLMHDIIEHPERYTPKRKQFLDAMARQPGFMVAGKTYCRILEHSKTGCQTTLMSSAMFVKVRFTAGPSQGSEGWMCDGDVGRTVMMP